MEPLKTEKNIVNIKMDSREADSEDINWNQLAHYGDQLWAFDVRGVLMSAVLKFRILRPQQVSQSVCLLMG
jgi:hypothetical protein